MSDIGNVEEELYELRERLDIFFGRSHKDEEGNWKEGATYVIDTLEQIATSLQGIDKSLASIAKNGIPPRL